MTYMKGVKRQFAEQNGYVGGATSTLGNSNLLNVALAAQLHSSMFYVLHTMHVLTINISSNRCTLQYNTHDIH